MTGARAYHEGTKHTPESVRRTAHHLDWSNRPHPFKEHIGLDPIPLPDEAPASGVEALHAISGEGRGARVPDVREIAHILRLAAGVIRVVRYPDGERFFFRTYACAGALYPIEVYLACGDLDGLAAGLYHYHPLEHTLRRLRDADPRPHLARAAGHPGVAGAPVACVLSGIPWRTTWKYRARGYRHLFWDAGMIVANLLALAAAADLRAEVVCGFADAEVNGLLGLDGRTEMALALVPLGGGAPAEPAAGGPEPIRLPSRPLSARTVEEPDLLAAHAATTWEAAGRPPAWSRASGSALPPPVAGPDDGIERVIRRRGSSRVFLRAPVPREQVERILAAATRGVAGDWGTGLVRVLAVANAVDGLAPGAYAWEESRMRPVREGALRDEAAFLCLEQPLGGDAALTCFLCADLDAAIGALGERGYRAAQLEAGVTGGRIYLAAYAHRLGATGLTFYDDEVRRFFGTSLEPMLVVAVGVDGRRRLLRP